MGDLASHVRKTANGNLLVTEHEKDIILSHWEVAPYLQLRGREKVTLCQTHTDVCRQRDAKFGKRLSTFRPAMYLLNHHEISVFGNCLRTHH